MTTSMPTHSGRGAPSLRRVSAQLAASTDIALALTTLVTCGELYAAGNPTIIIASVNLDANEAADLSFRLFRDGVEIAAANRFVETVVGADDRKVLHMHWFDAAPGNTPAYSLRALASVSAGALSSAEVPTRLTAFI